MHVLFTRTQKKGEKRRQHISKFRPFMAFLFFFFENAGDARFWSPRCGSAAALHRGGHRARPAPPGAPQGEGRDDER